MQYHTNFKQLNTHLGPRIESRLYFGGTAYLGIPQNEAYLALYLEGLKKFGLNNGTSRGNNVQLGIYDEVEHYAAEKYGSGSALITSSGYLAAQLTIKHFVNFGEIRYAPDTHPALWQNDNPQTDGAFANWAVNIVDEINSSDKENWVIISNSMNNLYPEIYDFSFLKQINQSKHIILLVDDSHGIGIINNGLSALSAVPKCENVKTIIIASMAKALGVDAGIIFGDTDLIAELKETNAFLGASPPAAAGLFAFMNAEKIYEVELSKLNQNIATLSNVLNGNKDWHFIPNFPVFFSKNADLSTKLLAKNILASSFPYPDKDGPIINRIVLSSWHTNTDIEELIKAL
ncbi:aminotransferase class I/II-fold pyridoxal phosphate-dependent enzyme [Pedobacter polaris]|uniref:Aminotransferase class I/II-fold pyridoxal phosphate-dependent enzyme n=1 Tax=Pedobacter polaris TaxID=2571273 RepID=A0A4U1CTU2_9SPHI|nr:aminotransferase class I/II-fold pyridoxal phosphate-dependent enzyme [Pedobacter polaris]TKC12631.1 aminotransferase class I/II-fold pyridoxal phosphate-dependent enzyme [Pedobacter polaris]